MKKDDIIVFKYEGTTLEYKVKSGFRHFLANRTNSLNRQIFDLLKIENRFVFCENVIGYSIINNTTDFPEVKTLEDLEKIVDALYQRIIDISIPKFKKGEKIKIVPRRGPETSYPHGYIRDMTKLANTTDTIAIVNKMSVDLLKSIISLEKYQEPFDYCLQNHTFVWTSAMLESVNKDNNEKNEPDTALWPTSEPRDLSVMQKESVEIYDAIKTDSILLPPELAKADIDTQTVTFGNIKTTTGTVSFKEESEFEKTYKLNFNVKPLKF